jgi:hypothetical protein
MTFAQERDILDFAAKKSTRFASEQENLRLLTAE